MAVQSLQSKRRILVVDDDADCRTCLCDRLDSWQYEVIQVASGMEALEELQHGKVDIVLLDVAMPHMDGAETLRAIKRRYSDITVFMMSAVMTPCLKQQLVQWGARGCLEKPKIGRAHV